MDNKEIQVQLNPHGSLANESVNFQLYQAIYNHITGKREILTQDIDASYSYTLENILELNIKIEQCLKQFNVKIINPSIEILHIKGRKEGFTSFEKLKIYNKSITDPIKSLKIQYRILLILPEIHTPQCYNIEINLFSILAIYEDNKIGIPFRIVRRFSNGIEADIKIEYVDYIVANTFMKVIEDWFKTNINLETNKFLDFMQKRSHWTTVFFKFSFALLCQSRQLHGYVV